MWSVGSEADRDDPQTIRTQSKESEKEEIIRFHDDLRAGDFSYITDADGEIHTYTCPLYVCIKLYTGIYTTCHVI